MPRPDAHDAIGPKRTRKTIKNPTWGKPVTESKNKTVCHQCMMWRHMRSLRWAMVEATSQHNAAVLEARESGQPIPDFSPEVRKVIDVVESCFSNDFPDTDPDDIYPPFDVDEVEDLDLDPDEAEDWKMLADNFKSRGPGDPKVLVIKDKPVAFLNIKMHCKKTGHDPDRFKPEPQ